ncbi:MAG: LAGLIDADG family homing endonuclease [Thaumarchaeota archaeon]|nr:LAGLIDADG family homing endonuclease [Nitrososphaerota archaeon]
MSPLLRDLYDVNPGITESHGSIFLYVYSKGLVLFKHEIMGMPIGRKNQLGCLPAYIHRATTPWVAKFLSGFYDTDGSVKLRHTPARAYPRISFAQKVRGVVADVKRLLNRFSIPSTMYVNSYLDHRTSFLETRWFLDINGYENFRLFMAHIGTRNPYTLVRIALLGLEGS